jgi:hypothetical protein
MYCRIRIRYDLRSRIRVQDPGSTILGEKTLKDFHLYRTVDEGVSLVCSLGAGELQLGGGAVLQLTISGQVALLADTQVGLQPILPCFFNFILQLFCIVS